MAPQRPADSVDSSIILPGETGETIDAAILTAEITTFTTATGAYAFETTIGGVISTFTSTGEVPITNAAEYSSIQSVESASRGTSATSTDPNQTKATATPTSSGTSTVPAGPIAGGVIGGLVFISLVVASVWLFIRSRRRQTTAFRQHGAAQETDTLPFEKAQLHANDIKPKNELPGSIAPISLLQTHSVRPAELPANEEVLHRDR